MSCLTLMPVISSNALASVFDSYSCVVIVSDTTAISPTPLALSLAAASANHFSSAPCCSLDNVEGVNSASIHFLAAASFVEAAGAVAAVAGAATGAAGAPASSFLPQAPRPKTIALIAVSAYIERFISISFCIASPLTKFIGPGEVCGPDS